MKLIMYKINKFRSIKGTEWIQTEKYTCFVGINESGKTNVLLPLWKFNPADKSTAIDLLLDYPRDEYSSINSQQDKDQILHDPFIEVLFKLETQTLDKIKKAYDEYYESCLDKSEESNSDNPKVAADRIEISDYLLIKKDFNECFYVYLSNERAEILSDDLEFLMGKSVFDLICNNIPKFVYYSEYGNLDSDLYLPHVMENLQRIESLTGKEKMKARTLKTLFKHLNLNPAEILKLGQEETQKGDNQIPTESRNKQERYAKLDSAATRLTKQFREWWRQGNYIFHFNADGQYFRIFVSDSERPEKIELESRSKGLQWFFSFFLVFLQESEDSHKNCILLLDEPGPSLHPNAQADLIRFFNQLSDTNQLLYTTHLPFLVDHNHLERVKAVFTVNGLTKVSNDLNKADKDKKSIQPVNAAIGINVSQSLLVGCDITIVEGISDQHYLTMIKNHLIAKEKLHPKREIAFVPVGGARAVKPVVSLILGTNQDLPYTLLDSDEAGKQYQLSLKNSLYSNEQNRVIETDTFTNKVGSEIEDLIPIDLLIDCFDRLFKPENSLDSKMFNLSKPIIPQLELFARENNIELAIGWKVELSKKVKQKFDGEVSDELEKQWLHLFNLICYNTPIQLVSSNVA